MKIRGFTLIELMIVLAILGILVAIAFSAINGRGGHLSNRYQQTEVMPETRCVDGFKFLGGTQLLDEKGHGVPCSVEQ